MSTNKTSNYQLHSWEPGDDFLLSEINENFDLLDAAVGAKAEAVFGFYAGDGANPRTIRLGFRPKAVILANKSGTFGSGDSYLYGGLLIDGAAHGNYAYSITDEGFRLNQNNHAQGNNANHTYMYVAFR